MTDAVTAGLLLALSASTAEAAGLTSSYTRFEFATCAEQPSPEPGVVEVRRCMAAGGIPVMWDAEPDASGVRIGEGSDGSVAGLQPFHEVEPLVEWRGRLVGGKVAPVGAVVRYREGRSIGHLGTTRLVVYRIGAGGRTCLLGLVAEPRANLKARALIDSARSCPPSVSVKGRAG